ncbi:PAS domain-containing sensor histidine kinase [Persicobacter psychrovividus]|uniref:histidine kinase n=1 Tax=Persicobacter psychrovividus TaxID=387638 RepID=A0ABM7VJ13_9BACT|nr:hypothetical protein PEPS_32570 [Persicobacter psychrovividus]
MIKSYLDKLHRLLSGGPSFAFEHRVLNIGLFVGFIVYASYSVFVLTTPIFPPVLVYTMLMVTIFVAQIYVLSRISSDFYQEGVIFFSFWGVLSNVAMWVVSGGKTGPSSLNFIIIFVVVTYLMGRKYHFKWFATNIIVMWLLFFFDEQMSAIIIPYETDELRELDFFMTNMFAMILIFVVGFIFRKHYEEQREALASSNELRERESKKYKNLIDSIRDEYFLKSESIDGQVDYVSPSVVQLLGFNQADFKEKYEEIFWSSEENKKMFSHRQSQMKAGHPFNYELEVFCADGKTIRLHIKDTPTFSANGSVTHIDSIVQDISIRHRIMQTLKNTLDQEQQMRKVRENFILTISHQFRTPLTVIRSSVDLMHQLLISGEQLTNNQLQRMNGRINGSVDQLVNFVDQILAFKDLDLWNFPFNPKQYEVKSFMADLLEQLSVQGRHLEFENCLENSLLMTFDYKMIEQSITNMVTNAIKYSSKEAPIRLSLETDNDELLIVIRDKGIGISIEDQKNLFNPFFRGKNAENIKGSGLGLSVCKEFVEKHHGHISVFSEEGVGSVFTIHLPLSPVLIEE